MDKVGNMFLTCTWNYDPFLVFTNFIKQCCATRGDCKTAETDTIMFYIYMQSCKSQATLVHLSLMPMILTHMSLLNSLHIAPGPWDILFQTKTGASAVIALCLWRWRTVGLLYSCMTLIPAQVSVSGAKCLSTIQLLHEVAWQQLSRSGEIPWTSTRWWTISHRHHLQNNPQKQEEQHYGCFPCIEVEV